MHLATNALRQAITLPYVEQFGLTMPEWRILSVLAHCRQLPFTELVVRSATDKGQLSRTLKTMQERGLVVTRNQSPGGKKLDCLITKKGLALHDQLIPLARRAQADMIRRLDPQERRVLFRAIEKLGAMCGDAKGRRGGGWGE
ncbi:MarR family transcriptional regulator [Ramlibacter sp. AW1]|uniref:MarR family transcriptional regulator n=2 Tax=Ramlibacter aurantiacus TaxID=2801330 RepID=A0A936ZQJ1_9BURK|nr:MarR family transcriptional regulator [Ramlibacter aurantiacus]